MQPVRDRQRCTHQALFVRELRNKLLFRRAAGEAGSQLRWAHKPKCSGLIYEDSTVERAALPSGVCVYNRVLGVAFLHSKLTLALLNLTEADGFLETIPLLPQADVPPSVLSRLVHSDQRWVAKDSSASWGLWKHYFEGKSPSSLLGWLDLKYGHVIQRFLPHPMLLHGRKFSVRSYVVLTQQHGHVDGYMHSHARLPLARDLYKMVLYWLVYRLQI